MKFSIVWIAVGMLIFTGVSCSQFLGGNDGPPVEMEELAEDAYSNYPEEGPITKTIRSQAQLDDEWKKLHEGQKPIPEVPKVDFNSRVLILVLQDTKPTGGYGFGEFRINSTQQNVVVTFAEKHPGENCMTTQALTRPYKLVAIPFTEKEVIFNQKAPKVHNCQQ
ncbi:protease complex subunit PrcB family protein [Gracilimonas tropica]|uniref:protease complex subunit PrcB family protein n=1 Tax=Gracilimonas tropica TaxID=454600 RepID=UPI000360A917|nr:protease complex subunit PrcB family protein [Gracilimonas tropica]